MILAYLFHFPSVLCDFTWLFIETLREVVRIVVYIRLDFVGMEIVIK